MKPAADINTVVQAVRLTRSLAIATFRQLYPDLYELSARAFETRPAGGINHHHRLGEFLTEWNNGLGRSPVEALALGQRQAVEKELAERARTHDDEH